MKKLSQGIASWLCRCKELSEFSAEIQYAVHQILWDLSTFILSLICLQLIYSDIQSGLLFAALFLPLHCVAGGAHAQTRLKCVVLPYSCLLSAHTIAMRTPCPSSPFYRCCHGSLSGNLLPRLHKTI